MDIGKIIDTAKTRNVMSERQLGQEMGLTSQNMTNWRRGTALPEDDHMIRLAELAGVDPARALMELHIARAERRGQTKAPGVLTAIMRQCAMLSLAGVLIAGAGIVPAPARADDGGVSYTQSVSGNVSMVIMENCPLSLHRLAIMVKTLVRAIIRAYDLLSRKEPTCNFSRYFKTA